MPVRERWRDTATWKAAAVLGLVTSTFSTVVASLGAGRLGQDPLVDWMVVAAIPLGSGVFEAEPTWPVILAGILFHQWADFSWAIVFFGVLGPWTKRLSPGALLLVALPWAVFTSALEWLALVPLFPFFQPVFTLEQSYALGFAVHAISSSLYPLFPWLRSRMAVDEPVRARRFAVVWGGLAVAGMVVLVGMAVAAGLGREWPHRGDEAADRRYLVRMTAHHRQGIEVARIALDRTRDPELNQVARLMVASQEGQNTVFSRWWRSWFGGSDVPEASHEEHMAMPGMLAEPEVRELREMPAEGFDARFREQMTRHHRGAIAMADEEIRGVGDIRLRIMAATLRHGQEGEIALLEKVEGWPAVKRAVASLLAPLRVLRSSS
jgi:uncharacterized protein (DUF305 family)